MEDQEPMKAESCLVESLSKGYSTFETWAPNPRFLGCHLTLVCVFSRMALSENADMYTKVCVCVCFCTCMRDVYMCVCVCSKHCSPNVLSPTLAQMSQYQDMLDPCITFLSKRVKPLSLTSQGLTLTFLFSSLSYVLRK